MNNEQRPRVLADGVTPKHERDARLMADRGVKSQAAIIAEYEASQSFHVVPFGQWREYFRKEQHANG